MNVLLVGLGGIIGSLFRYIIDRKLSAVVNNKFPLGTFVINLSGAFLIGLLSKLILSKSLSLFLIVGFLGAYTTFSTFMAEGTNIIEKNKWVNSYVYVLLSAALGVGICYLGFWVL